MAERLLGAAPEAIGAGVEAHPPVLAWINPLRVHLQTGQEPLKRGGIARFMRVKPDIRTHHADHRRPLPDVNMLSRAITLSTIQCTHRSRRRCIASQIVRLPAAKLERRLSF